MKDCLFCKIVNNEIPSCVIYEDDFCKCFLDINPIALGHSVLICKKHYDNLASCDEITFTDLGKAIKIIVKKLKDKLHADGFNIVSNLGKEAGQSVFHTHIHIIPRYTNDNLKLIEQNNQIKDIDFNKLADKINK